MAIALSLCGFFLWVDKGYTPVAVVSCVIVYNAAFGFSWVSHLGRVAVAALTNFR